MSLCVQGIYRHQLVHPLMQPGNVDLSADVDFQFLRRLVEVRAEQTQDGE